MTHKQALWQRPGFLISLVLLAYLLIGLRVVTDYGESWDEELRYRYARRSLNVYLGKAANNLEDEKGPFYGMVAYLGAQALNAASKAWGFIDGWHFMNFLSFLIGLYFFFRLCLRLVDIGPALGATLLFGTQPLIWGHAFINPKDIPFMAFFMGSLTLGLEMVDAHQRAAFNVNVLAASEGRAALREAAGRDWREGPRGRRRLLTLVLAGLGLLVLTYPLVRPALAWVIQQAYQADPSSWLGSLFGRLAQNAGQLPPDAYVHKAMGLYARLALPGIGLLLLASLGLAAWVFPSAVSWLSSRAGRAYTAQNLRGLALPQAILAGIFLGFASAIRTLGPASGLLVAGYFLIKAKKKAVPPALVYLGVGALVTYLAWPNLWGSPIKNYLASLGKAADFPWDQTVTFAGVQYTPDVLPRSYLPTLLSLQFTETAMLAFAAGAVVAAYLLVKDPLHRLDILLLGIWFLGPIAAAIALHSTLYDNFRQFLFAIPPLFVLAALSLQWLGRRLKRGLLLAAVVVLLIAPGVYWIIQLHPYEYIYYNSLTGGVQGAFRRFDLDYWATSYKKAAEYLNRAAPENSLVSVWGPEQVVDTYARSDLDIQEYPKDGSPPPVLPDFAVISTRNNKDQTIFPGAPVVFEVTCEGVTLAVVKQVR
jgi:hypothetical protein